MGEVTQCNALRLTMTLQLYTILEETTKDISTVFVANFLSQSRNFSMNTSLKAYPVTASHIPSFQRLPEELNSSDILFNEPKKSHSKWCCAY